ncbi:MAG TPA: polyphenol oxidase family protein [Acidimicrobiia bacterium]
MIHPPGLEGARFGEAADGDPRHDPSAAAALHAAGVPEGVAVPNQVHGSGVLVVTAPGRHGEADALVTTTPGVGVGVATADCVPVVIEGAGFAAVVHAGWRGIVAGVVEATLDRISSLGLTAECAAIGPAIGPCCYEVGPEVAERFPGHPALTTQGGISIDLPGAVADTLGSLVAWRSDRCTFTDPGLNSYRRDHTERRQVSVAWIPDPDR